MNQRLNTDTLRNFPPSIYLIVAFDILVAGERKTNRNLLSAFLFCGAFGPKKTSRTFFCGIKCPTCLPHPPIPHCRQFSRDHGLEKITILRFLAVVPFCDDNKKHRRGFILALMTGPKTSLFCLLRWHFLVDGSSNLRGPQIAARALLPGTYIYNLFANCERCQLHIYK